MENIKIFNNFIEKEDCEFIINWIDKNADDKLRFKHRVGVAKNKGLAVRAIFPDERPPSLYKDIEKFIYKYSDKFINYVKENYDIDEDLYFYGVSITRLSEDIQLRIHKDIHNSFSSLTWSCVIYLNDDYEDGEVVFVKELDKDIFTPSEFEPDFYLYKDNSGGFIYKPKALDAIIFPADQWHGGRPITKGNKYSIILWLVKEKEYSFEGFQSDRVISIDNNDYK